MQAITLYGHSRMKKRTISACALLVVGATMIVVPACSEDPQQTGESVQNVIGYSNWPNDVWCEAIWYPTGSTSQAAEDWAATPNCRVGAANDPCPDMCNMFLWNGQGNQNQKNHCGCRPVSVANAQNPADNGTWGHCVYSP